MGTAVRGIWLAALWALVAAPGVVLGQTDDHEAPLDMSLEDLLELEVTITTRQRQELRTSPSAVTIITQAQIRNSGMNTVAELLRLVPGMQVARVNSHRWAITARGFNSYFASKLLVMIDGRSVYDPRFAGVFWDIQDLPLADVERIEVIRGPGGSVWGANAVNGVVNIVTKDASATTSSVVEVGGGSLHRAHAVVRHGAQLNEQISFRVYSKYRGHRALRDVASGPAHGEWDAWFGGFRLDWQIDESQSVTVHGSSYRAYLDEQLTQLRDLLTGPQVYESRTKAQGGYAMAGWSYAGEESNLMVRAYYDRAERDWLSLGAEIDTIDLDSSGGVEVLPWLSLSGGTGVRWIRDEALGTRLTPRIRRDRWFHGFFQARASAWRDRLSLITGVKLEHNDYSGGEYQPTIRGMVKPVEDVVLWGAVSRAVRPPARVEHDLRVDQAYNPDSNTLLVLLGDRRVDAETVLAHELGARVQLRERALVQVSGFVNQYEDLVGVRLEPQRGFMEDEPGPPHMVLPLVYDNVTGARGIGVEVELDVKPAWWLSLRGTYGFIDLEIDDAGDPAVRAADQEGKSASHVGSLSAHIAATPRLQLNAIGFGVSKIAFRATDPDRSEAPAYLRLDLNASYQLSSALRVTVVGRNLGQARHSEYLSGASFNAGVVPRSVFAEVTAQF